MASLPHLNELGESLDPAKFQFISIDDEDQTVIETFLTRKKTSVWVGIDRSGGDFAWYGIKLGPTTVIIDGNGRIVAVTEFDSLTANDLRAVAERKDIAFKPVSEITASSGASFPDAEQPLFEVSLSKALPHAKESQLNHPPTGTDFLGVDADTLMTDVFNSFQNRYVLKEPLPDGLYNLDVNFVDVP